MPSIFQMLAAADSGLTSFLLGLLTYVGPVLLMVVLWKRLGVKPSARAVYCAFAWLVIGVLASIVPQLENVWLWSIVLFAALVVIDLIVLLLVKPLRVERELPTRFAINQEGEVKLTLRNASRHQLHLLVHDGLPEEGECEELPWSGVVPPLGYTQVSYPLKIRERGKCQVKPAHIQISTLFQFWTRSVRAGETQETRVYPNYEPVIQYALLAMESSSAQMGIVMKNRAGMSKDFHQLRDYQLGDTLARVDWKATSRKLQLISRDYQEQRDQNVILAIDCGQRMRAMDGEIPQFDHCLNAMLLLAYVALKQGDNVGILSFGGEERWLPPVKGVNSMTTILNHLYDYQTTAEPSDYAEAAERLLVRQRRRSLVVFLSNVRGEDGSDLVEPLRMVRQKHVTVLANIREQEVVERMETPVETLDDALSLSATQQYLDDRTAILSELRSHGIHSVDTTAQELPVALANQYLVARQGV